MIHMQTVSTGVCCYEHFPYTWFLDLNTQGNYDYYYMLSSFGNAEGSDATRQKEKGLPRIASVSLAKPTLPLNLALELALGLALLR